MSRNTGFPPYVTAFSGIDVLGEGCQISSSVSVMRETAPPGNRHILLGDSVMLFDRVRLLLGDTCVPTDTALRIGNRVIINVACYISGEGGLTIDDDVIIGAHVHVLSAGHAIHEGGAVIANNPVTYGAIHIGIGAWIGANSTILPGAHIGQGAVIGAGSVVTQPIPAFAVAVGNPARVVHYRKGHEPKRWWQLFNKAAS